MNNTSIQVYREKIEPEIKKRHERVMEAIRRIQPCTSSEVADMLNVPLHSISGRFTELSGHQEYGRPVIEACGTKPNRYGNNCTMWRIKEYGPVEQAKLF